ncbi:MAG: hypothetical protein R3F34_15850 [Planctomycetota bacterium]
MLHPRLRRAALACTFFSLAPCFAQNSSPTKLSDSEWKSLHAAYQDARHRLFAVDGGFEARSFGQHYLARFDGRGVRVVPDRGDWELGLELASFGRDGTRTDALAPHLVRSQHRTLEHVWSDRVTEWYMNGDDGLEHGFDVRTRPQGRRSAVLRAARARDLGVRVQDDRLGARRSTARANSP